MKKFVFTWVHIGFFSKVFMRLKPDEIRELLAIKKTYVEAICTVYPDKASKNIFYPNQFRINQCL